MMIFLTGVIYQKGDFAETNWNFDPILLVYLADIRLSICVGFQTGCIVCRIKLCIEW